MIRLLHLHLFRDTKIDEWNWGGIPCERVIRRCRCGSAKTLVRGSARETVWRWK